MARITHHEGLRQATRRRDALIDDMPALEDGAPDSRLDGAAERLDLRREIGKLSAQDQLLLALRYELDLTQEGIAAVLSLPEGTVKIRLHRARARIRAAMEDSATCQPPS